MKAQSYFNSATEEEANICDTTKSLCVNCVGVVNESNISNSFLRKDYYLLYMLDGKMDLTVCSYRGTFSKGEMLIISPNTTRSYRSSKNEVINYMWIHFTGYEVEDLLNELNIPMNTPLNVGIHNEIINQWNKLFHEFIINDSHFSLATSSILRYTLTQFSRYVNTDKTKNRLKKSVEYIYENYSSEISVEELAKMEDLSESHYRALFKSFFGTSPNQYIIDRRIEAAKVYLHETKKSIAEIADLVGYGDEYYFGRIFKKKSGFSPGIYRRQNK